MHTTTVTYQINVSTTPDHSEARCHVYRDLGAGPKLTSYKRGRDAAEAVREALRDVRMCRRGGMLVKR